MNLVAIFISALKPVFHLCSSTFTHRQKTPSTLISLLPDALILTRIGYTSVEHDVGNTSSQILIGSSSSVEHGLNKCECLTTSQDCDHNFVSSGCIQLGLLSRVDFGSQRMPYAAQLFRTYCLPEAPVLWITGSKVTNFVEYRLLIRDDDSLESNGCFIFDRMRVGLMDAHGTLIETEGNSSSFPLLSLFKHHDWCLMFSLSLVLRTHEREDYLFCSKDDH